LFTLVQRGIAYAADSYFLVHNGICEYVTIYIRGHTQSFAKTIDNDPQFNLRIKYLLSKAILPITVNELENLYIETFRLDFSPFVHCNKTEKAIIISTVNGHCSLSLR